MSTSAQEDSPATQRHHIEQYAARQGFTVVEWYIDEAISASETALVDRPAGAKLLDAIRHKKRPFDAVIFLRLDRVFRIPRDQEDTLVYCLQYKCEVWEVETGRVDNTSPYGEFILSIRALTARLESRLTGQRIREHNATLAAQGKMPSGYAPLGLRYDKETKGLTATDRAADVVRIFEVFSQTANMCTTAQTINVEGLRTVRNNLWDTHKISKILRNPKYRQRIHYKGKEYDAPELIPRIVPVELTDRVDALLEAYTATWSRAKGSMRAYSGRLTCSECGTTMTLSTVSRPSGKSTKSYTGWFCPHRRIGLCPTRKLSQRWIDRLAGQALKELLTAHSSDITGSQPHTEHRQVSTERKRERLESQKKRVVEAHIAGHLAAVGLTLKGEMDRLQAEIDALDKPRKQTVVPPEMIEAWIARLDEGWEYIPEDTKRALLVELDARMVVGCRVGEPVWVELETPANAEPIRVEFGQVSHRRRKQERRCL